jgi:LPXTG-motif cell wall-anchored protein
MKKSIMLALVCLLSCGGMTKAFAQEDSATINEEPSDTISIDSSEPKFYEEEAPVEKSSDTTTYVIVAGIVIIGGVAYLATKKKKTQ